MWVAEACFDGSEEPIKKLLRPGEQYKVGRKAPAALCLAEKTVSQEAGSVSVSAWSLPVSQVIGNVDALPAWPKSYVHVGKKKIRVVSKNDEALWRADPENYMGEELLPETERELENGDLLLFTRNSPALRIYWQPLTICAAPGLIQDGEMKSKQFYLARLGVAIVSQVTVGAECTHFVTDSSSPTAQFLEALVAGVYVVSDDFIEELQQIEPKALEEELTLPNEEEHFPNDVTLDNATFEELKANSAPNERRRSLFKGLTILFLSTSENTRREFRAKKHVYTMAGAHFESLPSSTAARLSDKEDAERFLSEKQASALSRLHQHQGTAPTSFEKGMIIITDKRESDQPWYATVARVSREMEIPMPEDGMGALQNAVMFLSLARYLTELAAEREDSTEERQQREESAVIQVAGRQHSQIIQVEGARDNTHTSEPRQPSDTQFAVPATPSRKPKRRAGRENADPFADVFGSSSMVTRAGISASESQEGHSQASDLNTAQQSIFSKSPSRPKRSNPANREQARRSDVWQSVFNESAPHQQAVDPTPASLSSVPGTSTQERYSKRFRMELDKDDQLATQKASPSQIRRETQSEDADVTIRPKNAKRRAEEEAEDERETHKESGVNSIPERFGESQPPSAMQREQSSTQQTFIAERPASTAERKGADERLLQSLASLKKSKKNVSALDREFDQLRIARPSNDSAIKSKEGRTILVDDDMLNDPDYRAWQGMTIDDFEVNAAGNFVQIDFVPLVRKRDTSIARSSDTNASWTNKPNFKKFRSKVRPQRQPVELDLGEAQSFVEIRSNGNGVRSRSIFTQDQRGGASATQQRSKLVLAEEAQEGWAEEVRTTEEENDEDDDFGLLGSTFSKKRSRSNGRHSMEEASMPSVSRSHVDASRANVDLRLDTDDDDVERMDDSDLFDGDATVRSGTLRSSTQRSKSQSGRQQDTITLSGSEDSDDEDNGGFAFKGFKARRGDDVSSRRSQSSHRRS